MYLVDKIIEKCENSKSDWQAGAAGGRSVKIEQKDYDACGKSDLIQEAELLAGMSLVTIKWLIRGSDIERIGYQVENLSRFYEIRLQQDTKKESTETLPKQIRIKQYQELLLKELEQIRTPWIRTYYDALLLQLKNGKEPKMLKRADVYFPSFRGIDTLKVPVYKRVFSRSNLRGSKVFEKEVQSHVIAKAREYCEEVEDEMNDTEVLSQLLIEEYSQELALKGPLKIYIEKEGEVTGLDLSQYVYGTVLNSETLKHAMISEKQLDIRRVITIENKANFVSAEYEPHTVYIYTHGYLSPREREFLSGLNIILGDSADFYHSGDLDYGGVKIFQYMKQRVFPNIKPLMMDVETYEKYIENGEPIQEQTIQKLEKTDILELQDLIKRMLEVKLGVEQECFLM